ncbi:MAG: right-handed parallel beta-helix repeat-containing protein [Alphaproteobacteria bacterium]|nr:right-handed parallel beta-helix repeat-containing protein [Alphaproteobacteria bacterium]MBU0864305.1 right-handed parallel beta-helix repeat-containing protein [Alphaproteobacteria bacterium]MBU1825032.1 right-handed parallel beta-helix repeat-containing protein [Alphaproteobacteria bacterium]
MISSLASLLAAATAALPGAAVVACPQAAVQTDCQFRGGGALQAAIDATPDGGTLVIRAGEYKAEGSRYTAYDGATLPAFLTIADRSITIRADKGAAIVGNPKAPSTAIVVLRANASISGLEVRDFTYVSDEDELYDGHGIFSIDSRLTLDNVHLARISKMAVSARGDSQIFADHVSISDSHVGFWLRERAYARIRHATVERGSVVGLCAYAQSSAHISDSRFTGFADDGIYSDDEAALFVTHTVVRDNQPFGIRAAGNSRITVADSQVQDNAEDFGTEAAGAIRRDDG